MIRILEYYDTSDPAYAIKTYRNIRNPHKYIDVKLSPDGHYMIKQYIWMLDDKGNEIKNPMGVSLRSKGRFFRVRKSYLEELLKDYLELDADNTEPLPWDYEEDEE